MACPPTLNLMGELLVVPVLWSRRILLAVIIGLMVFFRAAYNMYLYSRINHGRFSKHVFPSKMLKRSMILSLMRHFMPLVLILKSDLFNF